MTSLFKGIFNKKISIWINISALYIVIDNRVEIIRVASKAVQRWRPSWASQYKSEIGAHEKYKNRGLLRMIKPLDNDELKKLT